MTMPRDATATTMREKVAAAMNTRKVITAIATIEEELWSCVPRRCGNWRRKAIR